MQQFELARRMARMTRQKKAGGVAVLDLEGAAHQRRNSATEIESAIDQKLLIERRLQICAQAAKQAKAALSIPVAKMTDYRPLLHGILRDQRSLCGDVAAADRGEPLTKRTGPAGARTSGLRARPDCAPGTACMPVHCLVGRASTGSDRPSPRGPRPCPGLHPMLRMSFTACSLYRHVSPMSPRRASKRPRGTRASMRWKSALRRREHLP